MKDECIIVLQVKGIESRLKITEDRLFQERADRAGKLSEVEDKLLNENAKLQVLNIPIVISKVSLSLQIFLMC